MARGGRTASESSSLAVTGSRARRRRRRRRTEATPGAPTRRNNTTGEWRRPWKGCPGLGGAGATETTRGDRRRARARGRRPAACPAGLRLPTRSLGVCECWMVLEEAGEGSIYRRAARVLRAPPVGTCPWRPAMSSVSERGRRRRSSRGDCWRTGTSTGTRRRRRAQCAPHCCVGRTVPVLAAASSGVGERQGEVNGIETRMVAKFGTLGQTGEASTREQSARRHPERVDTHAWHHGHAWSPRELSPQASLRPKIMSGMLFVVVLKFTTVWFGSRCSREDFTSQVSFWSVTLRAYCGQTSGS